MATGDPHETRAWLTLLRTDGLGPQRLRTLIEHCGKAAAALSLGAAEWRQAGIPEAVVRNRGSVDQALVESDLRWLESADHHLLTCDDADYPALLAQTPNPPAALFVRGNPDLLWNPQIAVVGSRNPTAGGRDNARAFSDALARSGLTITSGLAEGVDAAAHRAALDAGMPTIAVMGTGPDRIYPAGHRDLASEIAASGALVTEFAPGTRAQRDHFPRRNRIVVGLSLGTLVVEAALKSGALVSARLASEAGREVFALPGSIHNPLARGCHRLIRDGASLVETSDEIIDAVAATARDLAGHLRARLAASLPTATPRKAAAAAPPEHARVLEALGHDPAPLDSLAERTGLTVDTLSSILLLLELDGRVAAVNGRYARLGS